MRVLLGLNEVHLCIFPHGFLHGDYEAFVFKPLGFTDGCGLYHLLCKGDGVLFVIVQSVVFKHGEFRIVDIPKLLCVSEAGRDLED